MHTPVRQTVATKRGDRYVGTADTRSAVARMLERGKTVREIAAALSLSTQAVYKHKKALDEPAKATATPEAAS